MKLQAMQQDGVVRNFWWCDWCRYAELVKDDGDDFVVEMLH